MWTTFGPNLGTGSRERIKKNHGGHGGHGEKYNSDQAFLRALCVLRGEIQIFSQLPGFSIPRLAADVLDIRARWRAVLENEARVGDVDRALTSVGHEQHLRMIRLKWTIGVGAAAHQEAVVE